jgi:hypothetical protein
MLVHCADDPRFKEMLKRLNLPESISLMNPERSLLIIQCN